MARHGDTVDAVHRGRLFAGRLIHADGVSCRGRVLAGRIFVASRVPLAAQVADDGRQLPVRQQECDRISGFAGAGNHGQRKMAGAGCAPVADVAVPMLRQAGRTRANGDETQGPR